MTTMLTPTSREAVAVRRAAVEAWTHTPVCGPNTQVLARQAADRLAGVESRPSDAEKFMVAQATYLTRAYIALIGADAELVKAITTELIAEAQELHGARFTAGTMWLRTCFELGADPVMTRVVFLTDKRDEPTIVAYAKAAGIPYDLACQELYQGHWEYCPQHGAKPAEASTQ